jgi:two-component system, NarL family, nitrate/nitrite response regulator NarL
VPETRMRMQPSRPGTNPVKGERVLQGHDRTEPRVFVVSPMRIYREGLADGLARHGSINVVGAAARINELVSLLTSIAVDVVLFDLAGEGGLAALRRLGSYPELKVVVLGLSEEDAHILACARAGIAGYVTHEDTLQELVQRIRDAAVGEFICSPRVAATLLRSLAVSTVVDAGQTVAARLTRRELEIVQLIERGLSNKEIARHLTIQVATVKNHVHNILKKLGVRHRVDAARVAHSIEVAPLAATATT